MIFDFLEKRARKSASVGPQNFIDFLSTGDVASGITMTPEKALQSAPVYQAVRLISETLASLPVKLYRRRTDGGKDEADGEPEYHLVRTDPNPEVNGFEWRQCQQAQSLVWGNGFSEIERDGRGKAIRIWQGNPPKWEVERAERTFLPTTGPRVEENGLYYAVQQESGETATLHPSMVFHLPEMSTNGVLGLAVTKLGREAIGLGLSAEKFGAGFFGNGARLGGLLKAPGKLTKEAKERLRNSFEEYHSGPDKAYRVAVLESGLDWQSIGIPPEEGQMHSTRVFQVQEVARYFNVPPAFLMDHSRSTFSNTEQQDLAFGKWGIAPRTRRFESVLNQKILTRNQREQGYFFEFRLEGLYRGDIASRYAAYATARQWGWMNANEIRGRENLDPVEGGDTYYQPMNMDDMADPDADDDEEAPVRALARSVFESQLGRLVHAEARVTDWQKHAAFAISVMGPTIRALYTQLWALRGCVGSPDASCESFIQDWAAERSRECEIRSLSGDQAEGGATLPAEASRLLDRVSDDIEVASRLEIDDVAAA